MKKDPIILTIANKLGGHAAFARSLGLHRTATFQWRRVPVDRLQAVEKLSGVPREKLRPDIFKRKSA